MKKLSPIVRLEDAFTMAKEEYGVDQFLLPQGKKQTKTEKLVMMGP
jgi:hypothetical protein